MILCCGEALIDMIPTPTADGAEAFAPHCGGAIFNTSIALGRLGAKAGLLTGLSSDMFGGQLTEALNASSVDTSYLIYSDRPTTLAFVRLLNGSATYSFFDENSAGRMLTSIDMPTLSSKVSALYFGGISLASEPGADTYASLLEREGDNRAVMVDPNIRPAFIRDETQYRARLDRMFALADIVKVSDEDLNWIVPGERSLNEKVGALRAKSPGIVILTRGGEGATGFTADGNEVKVSPTRVDVVDTVGAGDTFNAGVLAELAKRNQLSKPALRQLSSDLLTEALTHGAKVAAVTVSRAGANPPWANEL